MFIIAELDLPTLLFGFITMFATAVAYMYKDMRKDMLTITNQAVEDRKKCDHEIARLYSEMDSLRKGPCLKPNCPLNTKQTQTQIQI